MQELRANLGEELERHEGIQLRMLLERSKAIIERIKAKCHNGTLLKLTMDGKPVPPPHKQVGANVKKSWHFNINDRPDPQQTTTDRGVITGNQDILNIKQSLKQLPQITPVNHKQREASTSLERQQKVIDQRDKRVGKKIMGIADEFKLIDRDVINDKVQIEREAMKIVTKLKNASISPSRDSNSVGTETAE
ncbi:hypothetical protein FGO68_gene1303 [Halteria grandinella]|uniref:Uncharacterized protein n=1 Tax=Halteria grandinella TaxID=5974 RepID=A0A8J8NF88_HALGN|nr:hypothetical protein FGO68_gene1303 [Halteria grandinella]